MTEPGRNCVLINLRRKFVCRIGSTCVFPDRKFYRVNCNRITWLRLLILVTGEGLVNDRDQCDECLYGRRERHGSDTNLK